MGRPRKKDEEQQEQVEATPAEEPEATAAPAEEEAPAEEAPDLSAEEAPAEGEEPAPEPVAEEEQQPAEAEAPAEEPAAEAEPAPEEAPVEEPAAEATEPAVEEPAAEEAEPAAEAPAPAGAPEPQKNSKRHPRTQRRQRPKPKREKPSKRKPLVRAPKPDQARGQRKERRGIVVSAAMDKTIVVRVDSVKPHPVYKKIVRRSMKLHAHDEGNSAKIGDVVRVVETRPLSKTKTWRLAEIVEAAK